VRSSLLTLSGDTSLTSQAYNSELETACFHQPLNHKVELFHKVCGHKLVNLTPLRRAMRNAWHMSGGEGWAANPTCTRVLVTRR
jgi:hypothetical protein